MLVAVVDKVNATVALSPIGTWFRLEGCGHPGERTGSRFSVSRSELFALVTILNLLRQKFAPASQPGYVFRVIHVTTSLY